MNIAKNIPKYRVHPSGIIFIINISKIPKNINLIISIGQYVINGCINVCHNSFRLSFDSDFHLGSSNRNIFVSIIILFTSAQRHRSPGRRNRVLRSRNSVSRRLRCIALLGGLFIKINNFNYRIIYIVFFMIAQFISNFTAINN